MACVHVYCAECIKPHHEVDCFLLPLVLLLVGGGRCDLRNLKGVFHVSCKNKGYIASVEALGTWGKGAGRGTLPWLHMDKID